MAPPLLDLKRITVARGDRLGLDDVTLRIEIGEHVCILGPNGCGKSTLIKTLTRECQFGRRFRPERVIPLSPITRAM
jgi:ABC-type cobalamin/Fe3+-siderophores transport system ATPase subunit